VSDENDLALAREVIEPGGDRHRGMRRLITEVARRAGSSRAGGTGRWLAELVMDVAVPIPIRDLATLQAHHPGVVDAQLAAALVRNASVATGTVGALGGCWPQPKPSPRRCGWHGRCSWWLRRWRWSRSS